MFAAVADTHTTIWYSFADARLSTKARKTFEEASKQFGEKSTKMLAGLR